MNKKDKFFKYWLRKLRDKYKLVILNEETYEERFTFRLSRLNVFVALSTLSLLLILLTIVLIAFTPLREYIPGYTDMSLYRKIDALQQKSDSLEIEFRRKDQYLANLHRILTGNDTLGEIMPMQDTKDYSDVTITRSKEDSLLRQEYEYQSMYNVKPGNYSADEAGINEPSIASYNFFTPLHGVVTNKFKPETGHYGIDIVAKNNETVKATLDGVVIFADWTQETGYVIGIQHRYNIISVYKHNASLLKKSGEAVKAGDVIAIVGSSGKLTTGLHLHFEIWVNGNPVDPATLMIF